MIMQTRIEYAVRWNLPDGDVPPDYISHETSSAEHAQAMLDEMVEIRHQGKVVHRTVTITDWEE
jgi:hypothetical protein